MNCNSVSTRQTSTSRVRRHRQRQAAGVRFVACIRVEVTPELVAGLTGHGLLVPEKDENGSGRVTRAQITDALGKVVSDVLAG